MASPTKKLKVRRKLNSNRAGRARKARIEKFGTTQPSLPLDKPNANELAQQKKA